MSKQSLLSDSKVLDALGKWLHAEPIDRAVQGLFHDSHSWFVELAFLEDGEPSSTQFRGSEMGLAIIGALYRVPGGSNALSRAGVE